MAKALLNESHGKSHHPLSSSRAQAWRRLPGLASPELYLISRTSVIHCSLQFRRKPTGHRRAGVAWARGRHRAAERPALASVFWPFSRRISRPLTKPRPARRFHKHSAPSILRSRGLLPSGRSAAGWRTPSPASPRPRLAAAAKWRFLATFSEGPVADLFRQTRLRFWARNDRAIGRLSRHIDIGCCSSEETEEKWRSCDADASP